MVTYCLSGKPRIVKEFDSYQGNFVQFTISWEIAGENVARETVLTSPLGQHQCLVPSSSLDGALLLLLKFVTVLFACVRSVRNINMGSSAANNQRLVERLESGYPVYS